MVVVIVIVIKLGFLHQPWPSRTQITGDKEETTFLYQRLSVAIQRFNAIAFHSTFVTQHDMNADYSQPRTTLSLFFRNPDGLPYLRYRYCFTSGKTMVI